LLSAVSYFPVSKMGRGVFDTAFVLALISMALALPFVHEVYKDSFTLADWKHVVRASPFVYLSLLSIAGMIAVIQGLSGMAKVVLACYGIAFPLHIFTFLFGV
jgi:hypothetical protein